MSTDRDLTPAFIARCKECGGVLAVVVADVDSASIHDALKYRAEWKRAGLPVETGTVQQVRELSGLDHEPGCSLDLKQRKRRAKKAATLPLEKSA